MLINRSSKTEYRENKNEEMIKGIIQKNFSDWRMWTFQLKGPIHVQKNQFLKKITEKFQKTKDKKEP